MLKLYFRLLLIFASFIGILWSLQWFVLTGYYTSQLSSPEIKWGLVLMHAFLFLGSLVLFVASLKWHRQEQLKKRERLEVFNRRKGE